MNKNQHYVPQFYLKEFAFKKKKKEQINFFNKSTGEIGRAKSKKLAAEDFFYEFDESSNQTFEKYMGRWEKRFAPNYKKLISTKNVDDLTDTEKEYVARFMGVQFVRTKEEREKNKSFSRDLLEHTKGWRINLKGLSNEEFLSLPEDSTSLNFQEIKDSMRPESLKRSHLNYILRNADSFSGLFLSKKWILLENHTRDPFITSDNPVNYHFPNRLLRRLAPHFSPALYDQETEFIFPLNPKLCLWLVDSKAPSSLENKIIISNNSTDLHKKMIEQQNRIQAKRSTQYLFSDKTNFKFAKRLLKEFPEYKNVSRSRFTII